MTDDFRHLLYPRDHPKLVGARGLTAREFGAASRASPKAKPFVDAWLEQAKEPFRGLTCDGRCEAGLFNLADEGAPTAHMAAAARQLLAILPPDLAARLRYAVDAQQWRLWSNPSFLIVDGGLRLEDLGARERQAILAVVEASLSPRGFRKTRDCMHANAFLGQLLDLPLLMNEGSYHFCLFGEPSETEPWGWQLYGHHLALNCFALGKQMVISPTFMGAEPKVIDVGPHAGVRLFEDEERIGLGLMQSLAPELRDRAALYSGVNDPKLPPGRLHASDQFHVGGAFEDNRVVPYEGAPVSAFSARQKDEVMRLVGCFIEYLPQEPLRRRLADIERHLDRSWWSWAGGYGDDDPFYYRFQSPVIMTEFDHHWGVWMSNTTPAKCHIHTVVRTPNGNDYGVDLLKQHLAQVHSG